MKRILTIIFMVVVATTMSVQAGNIAGTYTNSLLGLNEGLPGNYVDDIFTDSNGFVWVATYGGGLVRYDGYSFTMPLQSHAGDRIGSNSCKAICEDKCKRLWVVFDEGVRVIDINTLSKVVPVCKGKPIDGILNEPTINITADANGSIWIVSRTNIYYICIGKDGEVTSVARTQYAASTPSVALADIDGDGTVWTVADGKIVKLKPQDGKIAMTEAATEMREAARRFVTAIRQFNGDVWIATNDGLYRYTRQDDGQSSSGRTPSAFRPRRYLAPVLTHNFTTCLAPYGRETLLVGTLGGVMAYDYRHDKFERLGEKTGTASMSSDFINCIMVMKSQIWIGTETGGIVKMTPRVLDVANYIHTADETSISANPVNSIYVESSGTLWVGTVDGGLNRKAAGQAAFAHYTTANSALTHNTVSTLSPDNGGKLWIGTWGGGVCSVDTKNPTEITPLVVDDDHRQRIDCIGALAYDNVNNGLWIGSNAGLYYYDYATRKMYDPFDGCRDIRGCIGSIVERSGRLWVGCMEGAYEVDLKSHGKDFSNFKFTHHKYKLDNPESRIVEKISCYCEASDGTLWLGSNEYGLYKRTKDKKGNTSFKAYTMRDGLANNSVKGIVEDSKRRLWITTMNGLSCLNPQTGVFMNYAASDGLLSSQFYWNSAVRSADGKLYLGSDKGLSELRGINRNVSYQGKLRFTKVVVDNQQIYADGEHLDEDISIAKELNLHESDKAIEIEFSALNYRNEGNETYSYRMRGFESEWLKLPAGVHSVRYTNLPSGDYTFEVRNDNDPDAGDVSMASIDISVSPYFWKSPIFVAIATLLVLALLVWMYNRKMDAVRRREAESLLKPIEEALGRYEAPELIRRRIENILQNQRSYAESSEKTAKADKEYTRQKSFMDRLIATMEKHYMDSDFGASELCEAMNINRTALSKSIQAETGMNTSKFIRNYRLSIAHRLLTSDDNSRNVTEIAYAVGFNDPKYFSRCFSEVYGTMPSALLNS